MVATTSGALERSLGGSRVAETPTGDGSSRRSPAEHGGKLCLTDEIMHTDGLLPRPPCSPRPPDLRYVASRVTVTLPRRVSRQRVL